MEITFVRNEVCGELSYMFGTFHATQTRAHWNTLRSESTTLAITTCLFSNASTFYTIFPCCVVEVFRDGLSAETLTELDKVRIDRFRALSILFLPRVSK
jgi:hypothetical protein